MGRINKKIFSDYSDLECDRKLFLDIGRDDNRWLSPIVKVLNNPWANGLHRQNKLLMELGKLYEQQVYSQIKITKKTKETLDSNNQVIETELNKNCLIQMFNSFKKKLLNDEIYLLEFFFPITDNFIRFCLDIATPLPIPLIISKKKTQLSNTLRPDIMILGNLIDHEYAKKGKFFDEILSDGTISKLTTTDINNRIGISIIDIKKTNFENIGKKHFSEIYFYGYNLSCFIDEIGLSNHYFVRIDGNGIFPSYDPQELSTITDFRDEIVELNWQDNIQIFEKTIEKLHELNKGKPYTLKSVAVCIQPKCGRCPYLEDCKISLELKNNVPDKDTDLRLMPYTDSSIANQLKTFKLNTIEDVNKNIQILPIDDVPNPIFPEKDIIFNKTVAIQQNRILKPRVGNKYSNTIPKFSSLPICFEIETDPIHSKAFAFSLSFESFAFNPTKVQNVPRFNPIIIDWWEFWKNIYSNPNFIQYSSKLNNLINLNLGTKSNLINPRILKIFSDSLKYLMSLDDNFKNSIKNGDFNSKFALNFRYSYLNGGLDDSDEYELMKEFVLIFSNIIRVSYIMEYFLIQEISSSAVYYWSRNQIVDLKSLIERNLKKIINDKSVKNEFMNFINWFAPMESNIDNPDYLKKIYDLRSFIESVFAFPVVINYTWHQIAGENGKINFNHQFWPNHFNYLDFQRWHEYLLERNTNKKQKLSNELLRQMNIKIKNINILRSKYQNEGQDHIYSRYPTSSTRDLFSNILPNDYHPISFIWYNYSKLNNLLVSIDFEKIRLTYPNWSIGKLYAAKIEQNHLKKRLTPIQGQYIYEITLQNMSRFMKIKENEYLLLLNNANRTYYDQFKSSIVVDTIESINNGNALKITSKINKHEFFPALKARGEWYLYPKSNDNWTDKLFKINQGNNGLLQRYNFGNSILGKYLSEKWQITTNKFRVPNTFNIQYPEIYMYYPQILPIHPLINNNQLLTDISSNNNHVDNSQKNAIINSLNNTISAIQGPPGTGKSFTISALIDEFVLRNRIDDPNRPIRILITALSYNALEVVFEMIRNGKDSLNRSSVSSTIDRIFIHSQYVEDHPHCNNLVKKGSWKLNGNISLPGRGRPTFLDDYFSNDFILFANAYNLYHLNEINNRTGNRKILTPNFHFDLIIVDEASQVPVDHFLSSLQFVNSVSIQLNKQNLPIINKDNFQNIITPNFAIPSNFLTKVVIVGDHNQLPPVQQVKPPKNLRSVLKSLFSYYVEKTSGDIEGHGIKSIQLTKNYRSNKEIVQFTNSLGFYEEKILPSNHSMNGMIQYGPLTTLSQWIVDVLEKKIIVGAIIHNEKFETSVSQTEAKIVAQLVIGYYSSFKGHFKNKNDEKLFWDKMIGIAAPHNAQCNLISKEIEDNISLKFISKDELHILLRNSISSVDKFQGSDRDFIISSIAISAKSQLQKEEEFIYDLNRFNVLTSRAKYKLILVCSENFLNYIPENRENMDNASKIRRFAMTFCNNTKHYNNIQTKIVDITLRCKI